MCKGVTLGLDRNRAALLGSLKSLLVIRRIDSISKCKVMKVIDEGFNERVF